MSDFLDDSLDLRYGSTPLQKKFKLIEYMLTNRRDENLLSSSISPNISEIKKEPFKDFVNIQNELESFV